jgi:hypothetical protein
MRGGKRPFANHVLVIKTAVFPLISPSKWPSILPLKHFYAYRT